MSTDKYSPYPQTTLASTPPSTSSSPLQTIITELSLNLNQCNSLYDQTLSTTNNGLLIDKTVTTEKVKKPGDKKRECPKKKTSNKEEQLRPTLVKYD